MYINRGKMHYFCIFLYEKLKLVRQPYLLFIDISHIIGVILQLIKSLPSTLVPIKFLIKQLQYPGHISVSKQG